MEGDTETWRRPAQLTRFLGILKNFDENDQGPGSDGTLLCNW